MYRSLSNSKTNIKTYYESLHNLYKITSYVRIISAILWHNLMKPAAAGIKSNNRVISPQKCKRFWSFAYFCTFLEGITSVMRSCASLLKQHKKKKSVCRSNRLAGEAKSHLTPEPLHWKDVLWIIKSLKLAFFTRFV